MGTRLICVGDGEDGEDGVWIGWAADEQQASEAIRFHIESFGCSPADIRFERSDDSRNVV